jgi:hypothetical protein
MFDVKYFIIFILVFILFYLICKKSNKESFRTSPFSEYSTNLDNIVYTDTSGNLVSVDKKSLIDVILPRGIIVIWNGSQPPNGWVLCNGSDGTPDLTGKFILGHNPNNSNYPLGKTGGAETHTLTIDEMPTHNHNVSGAVAWGGSGPGYSGGGNKIDGSISVSQTGGGKPHNNMPPYYVLAYIMKL